MNVMKALEDIYNLLESKSIDVRHASGKLENVISKYIFNEYTGKEHVVSKNDDRLITHYTSIRALVSMLQPTPEEKEGCLHMYDSAHFNDPAEGSFINLNFLKKYTPPIREKSLHAYIASFVLSEDKKGKGGNNLVFWREYGENGEGCSLSLPASLLQQNLFKVRYGHGSVKYFRDNFLTNLESFFKNEYEEINFLMEKIRKNYPDVRVSVVKIVGEHLERIRYLYKSRAYQYENECRLIVPQSDIHPDDVHFECPDKNNTARIRHYYRHPDLKIGKLLCSSDSKIVIGPCVPNPDDVMYCIKTLLKVNGLRGPSVIRSRITYRKT